MNQGNNWPLGSRFMTAEEISAQLASSAQRADSFSMTQNAKLTETESGRLSSELLPKQQAAHPRESRPVSWFGRP